MQKTVCQHIKKARENKAITQREMAELLFIDERNYRRLENGEGKSIDLLLFVRIARLLDMNISSLLQDILYRQ